MAQIFNNAVDNIPPMSNGIVFKYREWKHVEDRIESFCEWPAGMRQNADTMALAGFFYTGCGDQVVCCCCGVGIMGWEDIDNPYEEHAKWKPECAYIKQHVDQNFINKAVECRDTCQKEPGYSARTCEHADFFNRNLEIDDVNGHNEGISAPLSGRRSTCLNCSTKLSDVSFIPCGHVCVCASCHSNFKECPICRKPIRSFVKLYFT